MFALYENANHEPASPSDVADYASYIGSPDFPIFADGEGILRDATPMTQETHPEMCALTEDLTIIECSFGHGGQHKMLDAIRVHAGL